MKSRITRFGALVLAAPFVVAGLASTAQADHVKKIAVMAPEEGTDFGWNQQGVDGAKMAAAKVGGIEVEVADGLGYGDIRPVLRELAAAGVDLIIAHASGYNTAAPEIAQQFKVPVAINDKPEAQLAGLVADYSPHAHEGAFLAGVLAAKMTRTGSVGIVASAEPVGWNAQSVGFALGARSVTPDIEIRYAVIGPAAYADVAGGKRVTEAIIAAGADVIFGQGNGSSFGMLQAVETKPANDGGKVWFIDVIGNKTSLDKGYLLSSVLWDFVPIFVDMFQDIHDGTYGTRVYDINLADNSLALLKTEHIPADIWDEIMAVRQDIMDGKIDVAFIGDADGVHEMMTSVAAAE